MIRAEIHIVDRDPNGWTQQTTYTISADIGHWSTEVLEDLAGRVVTMRNLDAAIDPTTTEEDQ